ncbi:YxeA family protein [Lactobacillus curvatus]|nr:YxeA family protein [Latilactobacillus curvatus]MSE23699.1 YxeA family protein [Latilactobacillus curvatus]
MIKHKGWLLLSAIVVVFIGGSWGIHSYYYGGKAYYTQIVSNGTRMEEKDSAGKTFVDYNYQQAAYNEDGVIKKVDFNGNKATPLKRNAYLKLIVNKNKGVVSWAKVAKSEVPEKAQKMLNKSK